jgi:hypothetical protein
LFIDRLELGLCNAESLGRGAMGRGAVVAVVERRNREHHDLLLGRVEDAMFERSRGSEVGGGDR